jgi:hypothetical protein
MPFSVPSGKKRQKKIQGPFTTTPASKLAGNPGYAFRMTALPWVYLSRKWVS